MASTAVRRRGLKVGILDTPAGRKQFLGAVFTDAQKLWADLFAKAGVAYPPARLVFVSAPLVFFTSNVNTSCGPAITDGSSAQRQHWLIVGGVPQLGSL